MNKKADCIRTVANWSVADKAFVYDRPTFDKEKMLQTIPIASPKMDALFRKIKELDDQDMATDGVKYKHMVFTDIKSAPYGAKLLAAAFQAHDYTPSYDRSFQLDENKLRRSSSNNFALLCSSPLYGKPIGVKFRRKLLDLFNKRPDNVNGELIRFIILDQGFKEGIDLFDIKYLHLFEPLLSQADEKQAIGRGTRLCGQKGLHFDPQRGWPLHVFRYEVSIPERLQTPYNDSSRMFELFLRESGIDTRKLVFANTLEEICIFGAVDYELTKNVHRFSIHEHDSPSSRGMRSLLGLISGGVRKKKKRDLAKRVNVPRGAKTFLQMREFIKERFGKYTWPRPTLENKCETHGGSRIIAFNETQNFVRMYFQPNSAYKGLMLWHSVGTGKCFKKDTPILMYDGSIKMVQDVCVGDQVMGDDSQPRNVLSLGRGEDDMYIVKQGTGADDYTVNSEHILCLKDENDDVLEITIRDYLQLSDEEKAKYSGYRVAVDFSSQKVDQYPFNVGALDDVIPTEYYINDAEKRTQLLDGLLHRYGLRPIVTDDANVQKLIKFLARSLGYTVHDENGELYIDFEDTSLKTEITVEHVGKGDYYGFTVDGNNRFLLGDYTVTHNTCSAVATTTTSWERHGYNILWITRHTLKPDIWKNMYKDVCSLVIRDRMRKGEVPDDAIKKPMRYVSKNWLPPISYKQFSNMLAGKNDLYHEMVRRNGSDDILKKTFIIIDEAHKLFATDVPAAEKADVSLIYKSILDSYDKSGKDSARVLLMTATPYTTDPMHMVRLLNLMRPRDHHIPEDFPSFANTYLNSSGKFTSEGTSRFLDDIAGYISYLNREKDARQFAYPVFENIVVPMSESDRLQTQQRIDALEKDINDTTANVSEGKDAVKKAKQRVKTDKAQLTEECKALPTPKQRKECKDEVKVRMDAFERQLLTELQDRIATDDERIKSFKTDVKELKKQLKDKKADMSQEAALSTRCKI